MVGAIFFVLNVIVRKKLLVLGYLKLWILSGKIYQIFLYLIIVLKISDFFLT